MIEIKRILFPVDFSKNSSKILPYALTVSKKFGATIYLLHVVEDFSKWTGGLYIPSIPVDLYRKEALLAAERLFRASRGSCRVTLILKKGLFLAIPFKKS
jgi:nucleotide-binding universal stress UspA family protein